MLSKALSYLQKRSATTPTSAPAPKEPVWPGGASDFVAELGEDGEIIAVSAAAGDLLGVSADELPGRSLFDFVGREDRDDLRRAMSDAGAPTAPARLNFRLLRPRRAPGHAEISFAPAEAPASLVALVRDRSDELDREDNLKAAAETASNEAAARAGLMADLGHEMKTPLNAIMGFADTMKTETFGPLGHPKYREYVGLIHRSGAHLLDLITAILDFSKIESGRYVMTPVKLNAAEIGRESAEMIRQQAEDAGLKLIVSIDDSVRESFLDARALRQILLNLLANAVKFTSDGEIEINLSQHDDTLQFVVRDTGVGMSEKELAQLGARFTAAQGDGVRGAKGTGLGLSLAFALADLMNGALDLSSAPGEGVTATLTLPIVDEGARPQPRRRPFMQMRNKEDSDIKSQLDRVAEFRREQSKKQSAA